MVVALRFNFIVEKKWLDHLLLMTLHLVTMVKLILRDLGAVSWVERKVSEDELNSSPIGAWELVP